MSKILLVEDSPTQAMQIKLLLESAQHEVICCDDGTAALQQLASGVNEIVVTDLEMPVLNGLELVKQMRVDFPQVPSILITSHGSERLAAEALRTGAAAYVPKVLLNELLLGTVEDVLGVLRTDRSYAQLIDCTRENRLVFDLPSDPLLLDSAVNLVMQMTAGMKLFSGIESYRLGTALRHAASNALYRGNLELSFAEWRHDASEEFQAKHPLVSERLAQTPYKNRRIQFDARITRDEVRVVIHDGGSGFDHRAYTAQDEEHALTRVQGRGLVHIRNFTDKLSFNGAGNELTLVKHCSRPDNGDTTD